MVIKQGDKDYMNYIKNLHHDEFVAQRQQGPCDELVDPIYKFFLQHLRKDGKSYALELKGDNDLCTTVKYEKEDDPIKKNETDTRSSRDILSEERYQSTAKRVKKSSCTRPDEIVELFPIPEKQPGSPILEESYMTFLRHIKVKNGCMILELDSISVAYEEEIEPPVSPEILELEGNVSPDEQGLTTCRSIEPADMTVHEDGNSSMAALPNCTELFKMKLMTVLDKPYNQAEYEELLKEATERKPLTKQKHLRSMSISYPTDEVGQSYLDRFPDLAKQIWPADPDRRLNLLRGFFFWLKNLCHKGAFRPWAPSEHEVISADDYEPVCPNDMPRD